MGRRSRRAPAFTVVAMKRIPPVADDTAVEPWSASSRAAVARPLRGWVDRTRRAGRGNPYVGLLADQLLAPRLELLRIAAQRVGFRQQPEGEGGHASRLFDPPTIVSREARKYDGALAQSPPARRSSWTVHPFRRSTNRPRRRKRAAQKTPGTRAIRRASCRPTRS